MNSCLQVASWSRSEATFVVTGLGYSSVDTEAGMLSLVKYEGDHVGRTLMAVKCSREIIPLICDSAEEEIEYKKLCQLDIIDVRGQNSPLSRPCIRPPGAIIGIAEPPPGWPWWVVMAQPFAVPGLQRGYWSFDLANDQDDAVRQLKELLKIAGLRT